MAKRALLSVADKSGIAFFAVGFNRRDSSWSRAAVLPQRSKPKASRSRRVADVTGSKEILGGRVKTLHPVIHAGILARRDVGTDVDELARQEILPIDVVAVNFYPFEATLAAGRPIAEVIENIDIGGPSMLRAAAKNFRDVIAVIDPGDYDEVLEQLTDGVRLETRLRLAAKAFAASASYERAIADYIARLEASGGELAEGGISNSLPDKLFMSFDKVQDLRYGENPHQTAAFYRDDAFALSAAEKLHGKELSYNNILDLDAAWRLVRELDPDRPAAVVIKHTNPAGAALGPSLVEAYVKARATDPVSAFGGIVALNRAVDSDTATELSSTFLEAVVAPGFEDGALEILTAKKNLRLMRIEHTLPPAWPGRNFCRVLGGVLVQAWDADGADEPFEVVTERAPSDAELTDLRLAWVAAKHVKSNAIVVAKDGALLGVGAGQMSRVDSCRLAASKANALLAGSVAASDAFFPFRDGVDALAEAGVVAIVQPGGSVRDDEVIQAANERGVAMVFTGKRHFKH